MTGDDGQSTKNHDDPTRSAAYPHGDTVCAGCHACQPERFPNTSAAYCGCYVCNPTGAPAPAVARESRGPKPQWGVRLKVGIVTYFNDEPLVTWEQAQEARQKIEETTGEFGDVEKVYVL